MMQPYFLACPTLNAIGVDVIPQNIETSGIVGEHLVELVNREFLHGIAPSRSEYQNSYVLSRDSIDNHLYLLYHRLIMTTELRPTAASPTCCDVIEQHIHVE